MMNSYAAVLVGGKGKRLRNLTKKTPKPLIKINNKEFLKYLLSTIPLMKRVWPKLIIYLIL